VNRDMDGWRMRNPTLCKNREGPGTHMRFGGWERPKGVPP